jgi:major type 1 subunit fimbrin (pilin)
MNRTLKLTLIAALFSSLGVSVANASEGTLIFSGSLVEASCSIDPSSTTDVPLGEVDATAFSTVGDISPKRDITINLTGCPTSQTGVTLTNTGQADATNNNLLAVSGDSSATGLGVAIYNKGGELIPMASASAAAPIDPETGTATINLEAAAMSTAESVGAGDYTATTNFELSYN